MPQETLSPNPKAELENQLRSVAEILQNPERENILTIRCPIVTDNQFPQLAWEKIDWNELPEDAAMVFQSSDREISTPSIVVASHVIEGMVKDIMTDPSDIDRETRDIILYWQQYSKGPTDDAKPLEPFDYKLFVQVNSPHADVYRPAIASVFRKITKDVNQRQQKLANNPVVKTIQSIKNFGNQAKQSYKEKFRLGKKRIRWGKDNKPAESTPQTPSETLAERIKFGDPETTLLQELEQALLHLEECSALAELIDQGFPSTQKGQDNEYIAYAQLYANFKQYQQLVPPNLPLTSTLQTRIANIGIKLDNHFRPGQS